MVAAQVSWPLSLSSALSVEVDDIQLVLRVASPASLCDSTSTLANSTYTTTSSRAPPSTVDGMDDGYSAMAESLISVAVASEFVKEELTPFEDAALRESLHLGASSIGDLPVPGAFGAIPRPMALRRDSEEDVAEVTMLAGLIERILARLTVKVRRITLRLVMEDEEGDGGATELEVRIDEIVYADEKGEAEAVGGVKVDQSNSSSIRSLKIAPPQILLRTLTPPASTPRRASSSESDTTASADSTSSEEEDISHDHDMMMSQSIADLRTSFVSASSESSASMYASARGSTSTMGSVSESRQSSRAEGSSDEDESPFLDPEVGVEIEPQGRREASEGSSSGSETVDDGFRLVLSCGTEPICIVISTAKSALEASSPVEDDNTSSAAPPPRQRPPPLNVQSSIPGPITLLLYPPQVQALLALATALAAPSPPTAPSPAPAPLRASSSAVTVAINLKAINGNLVYDVTAASPSPDAFAAFWAHPSTYALPPNHLRLRLEGLGAWIVRDPNEPPQTVFPLRSFSLTESVSLGGEVRTLPVLLSDANLVKQYEVDGAKEVYPTFETFDWLENRAAEGRGWRVKLKARQRGSTGTRAETPQTPPKPSAAVTLTLDDGHSELTGLPRAPIRADTITSRSIRQAPSHSRLPRPLARRTYPILRHHTCRCIPRYPTATR